MNATVITHKATVDTREQEYVEGKGWRGVPGTGEALPCHCCGRMHEVHALMVERERDPARDTVMKRGWRVVRHLNYGVSCAKKIANVPAGSVTEQVDRHGYQRMIALVREAA